MPTSPADNSIMTIGEVADYLKVTERTIYRLAGAKRIALCLNAVLFKKIPFNISSLAFRDYKDLVHYPKSACNQGYHVPWVIMKTNQIP